MKFNLRIDDLEARSLLGSAEIVKWVKDKGIYVTFVLAHWKRIGDEYVLQFVQKRPFNLNIAERDIFWKLAMWGQSLLKGKKQL